MVIKGKCVFTILEMTRQSLERLMSVYHMLLTGLSGVSSPPLTSCGNAMRVWQRVSFAISSHGIEVVTYRGKRLFIPTLSDRSAFTFIPIPFC